MSGVNLSGIVKSYGAMQVVHGIDLTVAEKEFVVLVGPSGCGKSTTLRMIAGLEEITAGDLTIHDRRVNRIAPKDRDVAMVFQNYALYPHLNVADNMAFGLRIRKMPKNEIKTTIDDVAEILGLTEYLDRRPADLSGGQRQRVAMGRAIVRHPKVFLFDEPLSNLDAKLRTQMRAEIKRLMNNGAIEQIGTPMELFNNPSNTFVAGFLGSPPMNQMKGTLTDSGALVGDVEIKINGATGPHAGRNVIVGIRPEHVTLTAEEGTSPLPINLDLVEPLGSEALLHARHGEDNLVFKANTENDINSLSGVNKVHIPAHLVKIFDADTGKALVLGD